MSKRSPYSPKEKYQIISEVMGGRCSVNSITKKYSLSNGTIESWIHKYNEEGLEGLKEAKTWKRYDREQKQKAILAVLNKEMSLRQATLLFQISSHSVLRKWISSYTKGETLKFTSKGSVPKTMTKGRKTTYQERIEIAQYTIANELNYAQSIEKYDISYQQVYSWVKKYQQYGEEALKDNRGRNRSSEFLTEEERLKLRVKELEARNKHLEMENDFVKKLQEVRRRNHPSR
ncbi:MULTISPECIES: helix-turn-helix domain-containing protein [Enterococcus]|nr:MULTISPECIES: helix-turn-helix domain-containing protein [Enterococcus]MDB7086604.1 helix-turn-helix domain-containing protein [Enterococcus mundtii]NBA63845.1 helix-turn-helix domain-containing protein [Enterococcus mundtii]STD21733.1 transposase family protein [Enterococcus mundtii]STD21771.1 transposase family protein [Enterococcus mundtii]STD23435.1 transposase family protein [Enterococcus mundtii]